MTTSTLLWILHVQNTDINVRLVDNSIFVSLTDMIVHYGPDSVQNRIRTKDTIEFLWAWELMHNPHFKSVEFDGLRNEAWTNRFFLSPKKWIETTNAIGIQSKKWRYDAGVFAHQDIAFEFASWLNPVFKLYIIKEFQRLKQSEAVQNKVDRQTNRILTKINHKIHTDSIKENLVVPKKLTKQEIGFVYASEVDLLNKALFGMTAKEWKESKKTVEWNMRDGATIEQLVVLANLENLNAEYIKMGLSQAQRIELLNKSAIDQLHSLSWNPTLKKLHHLS